MAMYAMCIEKETEEDQREDGRMG